MSLLDSIHSPDDLRRLTKDQLPQVAAELRARLIDVCRALAGISVRGLVSWN